MDSTIMGPLGMSESDKNKSVMLHPLSLQNGNQNTFEGIHTTDLLFIFGQCNRIAFIVDCVTHKKNFSDTYRFQFLVGEAGTGKALLAKSIAYKICSELSSWSYDYQYSSAFIKEFENETNACFHNYLEAISALEKPIIIIIDQLSTLIENNAKNKDTGTSTSSTFVRFMHKEQSNKNLFFIGIMDSDTSIDLDIKNKMFTRTKLIKKPIDLETKRIIFTSKLVNKYTKLHPDVTNEWLISYLDNAPAITGHLYRELANHVHELLKQENPNASAQLITQEVLITAFNTYETTQGNRSCLD